MAQPIIDFTFSVDAVDDVGNDTKVAFPNEIQQTGLRDGTPLARVWLNHIFNLAGQYFTWFKDEVYSVGAVLSYTDATIATTGAMEARFGGTWTLVDAVTRNSILINTFVRTA